MSEQILGNVAEWAGVLLSVLAMIVAATGSGRQRAFKAAERRQREAFESDYLERQEKTAQRLQKLESALQAQLMARERVMIELAALRRPLSRVFTSFRELIAMSLQGGNDELVQAVREVLPPMEALHKFIDANRVMLKPRHARELRRFETFLIELFLDVSRTKTVRQMPQYQRRMQTYSGALEQFERRAKWLLDAIFSGRSIWCAWTNRVRRVGFQTKDGSAGVRNAQG